MEQHLVILYGVFFLIMFYKFQLDKIRDPLCPYGLINYDKLPSILI
jgi:hypothetical protein